jgi:hypothetical protein
MGGREAPAQSIIVELNHRHVILIVNFLLFNTYK